MSLMGDAVCGWDVMSPEERLEALADAINAHLVESGYARVNVIAEDSPLKSDGTREWVGSYSDSETTIRLDSGHVADDGMEEVIDTAYHESAHAMQYQDGNVTGLSDKERAAMHELFDRDSLDFGDADPDLLVGYWEELEAADEAHESVTDHARYFTEQALAEAHETCNTPPIPPHRPAQYGVSTTDTPITVSPETTSPTSEIEIEMGEPVVTDEDGFSFEMGEPTVTGEDDIEFEILYDEATFNP